MEPLATTRGGTGDTLLWVLGLGVGSFTGTSLGISTLRKFRGSSFLMGIRLQHIVSR